MLPFSKEIKTNTSMRLKVNIHHRMGPWAKLLRAAKTGLELAIFGVIIYGAYQYYLYKLNYNFPERWRRVGILKYINIFPIKSCAPLQLKSTDEIHCDYLGLVFNGVHDRTLMVIDKNNHMITGRFFSKMVLIQPFVIGYGKIAITAPDVEEIEVDFAEFDQLEQEVWTEVWTTPMKVRLCGAYYDKWFSRVLFDKPNGARLVYYRVDQPVRKIMTRLNKQPFITKYDRGAFNDATSYMFMNMASVNDVNKRLHNAINPLQFRGNLYLEPDSDTPYVEDHWKWVKIGTTAMFRVIGPCTRCLFTTVNVDTGQRDPDGEPYRTLASYRLIPEFPTPAMGVHLGTRQTGTIKLGDEIYIEDD